MTRKTKRSMVAAVTFAILPLLVIIKSAGTLLGSGPVIAQASFDRLPFIVPDAVVNDELSLTDQQREAVDYIAILQSQQFGTSPLHRATESISGDEHQSSPSTSPLQITIQMIMSSSKGNTALIDGNPYKVGQNLKDSAWVVRQIDGVARTVTLENSRTGKSVVIQVQTPG